MILIGEAAFRPLIQALPRAIVEVGWMAPFQLSINGQCILP